MFCYFNHMLEYVASVFNLVFFVFLDVIAPTFVSGSVIYSFTELRTIKDSTAALRARVSLFVNRETAMLSTLSE